ncbi:MAG: hypothetical protein JNK82_38820 [Myxococcaceae bacterium]|nr:hypothetical protein [Myxococcaceae bacterium]
MSKDPAKLRSVAVVELPSPHWFALEPVLDALNARGFEFGTPIEKGHQWRCEYGPFALAFGHEETRWCLSMPIHDDNVATRALLKTIDEALHELPGVTRVDWYKREDRAGAAAPGPIDL